jgi:hypothetical protein
LEERQLHGVSRPASTSWAGFDDMLENRSLFFGTGVTWHDDNLKYLFSAALKL